MRPVQEGCRDGQPEAPGGVPVPDASVTVGTTASPCAGMHSENVAGAWEAHATDASSCIDLRRGKDQPMANSTGTEPQQAHAEPRHPTGIHGPGPARSMDSPTTGPPARTDPTNGSASPPTDTHPPPPEDMDTHAARIQILTLNIRGSNSIQYDVAAIHQEHPEATFVVLTETKRNRPKIWLPAHIQRAYANYHATSSHGNARVMVLVRRELVQYGTITHHAVPNACAGCVTYLTASSPGRNTLHLLGVYAPGDQEHLHMRQPLYDYLSGVLATAPAHDTVVLTGDWNAALCGTDRCGPLTTVDRQHRAWVRSHTNLASVYGTANRHPTFSVAGLGASPSTIDDTLVRLSPDALLSEVTLDTRTIAPHAYDTDHALLSVTLDASLLNLQTPVDCNVTGPGPAPTWRLLTPVSRADEQTFQNRFLATRAGDIRALSARLSPLMAAVEQHMLLHATSDARAVCTLTELQGRQAADVINEVADQVHELLRGAQDVALTVCKKRRTNPTGTHYRPNMISRGRKKLMLTLKSARRLAGVLRAEPTGEQLEIAVTELAHLGTRLPPTEPGVVQQDDSSSPATQHDRLLQEAGRIAKRASDAIR